jgi:putrescine transport system substrate-binding protein
MYSPATRQAVQGTLELMENGMPRKTTRLFATSALLAVFTLAAHAEDRVVNVFNWSDYIDSSILDDFTKETGFKVVYDVYDSN